MTDDTTVYSDACITAPLLAFPLLSPVFVFLQFGFLFKRKESDVFDAFPAKRRTVFRCFFLAWLTHVAGIILVTEGIGTAAWLLLRNVFIPFAYVWREALNFLLLSLFTASFAYLAVTVAGTAGTAVFFGLSTFFLPAVGAFVFEVCLAMVPGLDTSRLFLVKTASLRTLRTVRSYWTYPAFLLALTLWSAAAFLLSCFLFGRRRSEYAGVAAPSPGARALMRTAVASLPTLWVAGSLLRAIFGYTVSKSVRYAPLWCSCAAVFLWFAYELLTTKSFKKMLQSVKTLWLLPALTALFVLSVLGVKLWYQIDLPRAEKVVSVTIDTENSNCRHAFFYGIDKVEVAEPDGISECLATLTDTVHTTGTYTYQYRMVFRLQNGRELYRIVRCNGQSETTYRELCTSIDRAMYASADYREKVTCLEPFDEEYITLSVPIETTGEFTSWEAGKVFRIYCEEYAALSPEERFDLLDITYASETTARSYKFIVTRDGMRRWFVLSEEKTPEAYAQAMKIITEKMHTQVYDP